MHVHGENWHRSVLVAQQGGQTHVPRPHPTWPLAHPSPLDELNLPGRELFPHCTSGAGDS